jgi:hypothetical protein
MAYQGLTVVCAQSTKRGVNNKSRCTPLHPPDASELSAIWKAEIGSDQEKICVATAGGPWSWDACPFPTPLHTHMCWAVGGVGRTMHRSCDKEPGSHRCARPKPSPARAPLCGRVKVGGRVRLPASLPRLPYLGQVCTDKLGRHRQLEGANPWRSMPPRLQPESMDHPSTLAESRCHPTSCQPHPSRQRRAVPKKGKPRPVSSGRVGAARGNTPTQ